ncbi:MAG: serine/threonine-protein kinase [Candidatus Cohnella colombiensis]|uniref:non-specific serine/threonine protein kinase n=1 Tax=Candidatus Cohnella colombiensis TaxID=3121368 RepID=A0AA95EYH3_9BACL|nr:MAG: serine/threonine-protein kinase [Cohnella sp.]
MLDNLRNKEPLKPGHLYQGRYRIVSVLGKGGMGCVYMAEDTHLGGKLKALKLTKPMPGQRDAFLLEAKLMCRLEHPNLAAITDYYPPDESGYAGIVMTYVAGDTLAQRFVNFRSRLPFQTLLRYLIQLCDVLGYLHRCQPAIVYRDLKPANIMIDQHDQAILVDFGIARIFRSGNTSDTLQLGTPGFAAPEQLHNDQSDPRTDLYGLGALAYYLLSGGRFAIRHVGALEKVLQDDVPYRFIRLLEQLLSTDPQLRPQTANELYIQLSEMSSDDEFRQQLTHNATMMQSKASIQDESVTVIAIASAYPGAGASFVSLAVSALLNRRGIVHALVESPSTGPELYSLLDGARMMPSSSAYSDPTGQRSPTPRWAKGNAAYYPIHPEEQCNRALEDGFGRWIRRLGVPIVLLDVSSGWMHPACSSWLEKYVDRIWMIADCHPVKWSSHRQQACLTLQLTSKARNQTFQWIANRDQPFKQRKMWLSMFPDKPFASFPALSSANMLHSLWSGEGLPNDMTTTRQLDGVIEPLIAPLLHHFPQL